jgi:hypothetical protein
VILRISKSNRLLPHIEHGVSHAAAGADNAACHISYANAERRQVARLPEGVHRVRLQNKQLKRCLRAIVSRVDGQCGGRTSRGRRIDSGGAEMFNNSFQGLF